MYTVERSKISARLESINQAVGSTSGAAASTRTFMVSTTRNFACISFYVSFAIVIVSWPIFEEVADFLVILLILIRKNWSSSEKESNVDEFSCFHQSNLCIPRNSCVQIPPPLLSMTSRWLPQWRTNNIELCHEQINFRKNIYTPSMYSSFCSSFKNSKDLIRFYDCWMNTTVSWTLIVSLLFIFLSLDKTTALKTLVHCLLVLFCFCAGPSDPFYTFTRPICMN